MLDQNTDRIWYVIGAVLIGAAIILILNGTVPDLFGQVASTYEEKTEEAMNGAEKLASVDMVDTGLTGRDIQPWHEGKTEYISEGSDSFLLTSEGQRGGFSFPAHYFQLGETYTLTFDITKLEGTIDGIVGHLLIAGEDDVEIKIDGRPAERWEIRTRAKNPWQTGISYPNDEQTHTIELTFTKTIDDVADKRVYVQPNRMIFHSDYKALFENIALFQHEEPKEEEV